MIFEKYSDIVDATEKMRREGVDIFATDPEEWEVLRELIVDAHRGYYIGYSTTGPAKGTFQFMGIEFTKVL